LCNDVREPRPFAKSIAKKFASESGRKNFHRPDVGLGYGGGSLGALVLNPQNVAMNNDLPSLTQSLRDFAQARNWEQFHSPKNLASALSVEAAELLEHFQWLTEEQSCNLTAHKKEQVAAETADVLLYLLQITDKLGIDLLAAARAKMIVNAEKYPVDLALGSSRKYTEL
jgi:dCTP diphosphatase